MADAATLKLRYPAFASTADATIDYWLADAERIVTPAWIEADQEPALLALAAHNMAAGGVLPAAPGAMPAGVTSFRSGTFAVTMTEAQASATGFDATPYGREFLPMLRRNRGGPRVL